MYQSVRKWSDRDKQLQLPLFTGYVFCRFNENIRWPIITTPGVIRLVREGTRIAVIDDAGIEAIRVIERLRAHAEPCPYPKVHERVRILDGPLAGVEGLLVNHKKNGRFILEVDAIQRCISVEIAGFNVVSVSAPPVTAAYGQGSLVAP